MKFKSYSNIWKVEKMLYSLDTINLPFPVSFSQCAWFVLTLLAVIMFDDIPPLSFTDNVIIKYIAIPVFMAWFMNKKSFDGKKPYKFIYTAAMYLFRPKTSYAGRTVKLKKEKPDINITAVRSDYYEVSG
ncbi:MAG: conjugal transfer protein [Lachnospiraceae bacterium]|nr:conjugal transfer protein [Lachnospiraceae bacterium]